MAVVNLNSISQKTSLNQSNQEETPFSEAYQADFVHFSNAGSPALHTIPALRAWRSEAMLRVNKFGLPTPRHEAWRNFPLNRYLSNAFSLKTSLLNIAQELTLADIQPHVLPDAYRLVFVDGHFSLGLSSSFDNLPEGLQVTPINNALEQNPEAMLNAAGMLSDEYDAFALLNAALFQNGACVKVQEGCQIDKTVELVFIASAATEVNQLPGMVYMRNHVSLAPNSKLTIFVQQLSLNVVPGQTGATIPFCHNIAQHITLMENAALDMTILTQTPENTWLLGSERAELAEKSSLNLSTVSVGKGIARHSVEVNIRGEGADAKMNGLDILNDKGTTHHETRMSHYAGNATSDQFYKGILDDSTQVNFSGMVFVATDADGTDSRQLNRNLLLSDNAKASTRPQLQINAHDVKCAHGATVGSLEPDQLFYLASRGLGRGLAQSLLTYGFAEEIVLRVDNAAIRKVLNVAILKSLHVCHQLDSDHGVISEKA